MATKFTLVLLSKIILKLRYSKSCILYIITYTKTETLLNQPLRFILTVKSNNSMISFGSKHCKYYMHYILACILSMHCIYVFHWWQRLLHNVFVRTIDSSYVSIKHYPKSPNLLVLTNVFHVHYSSLSFSSSYYLHFFFVHFSSVWYQGSTFSYEYIPCTQGYMYTFSYQRFS